MDVLELPGRARAQHSPPPSPLEAEGVLREACGVGSPHPKSSRKTQDPLLLQPSSSLCTQPGNPDQVGETVAVKTPDSGRKGQ